MSTRQYRRPAAEFHGLCTNSLKRLLLLNGQGDAGDCTLCVNPAEFAEAVHLPSLTRGYANLASSADLTFGRTTGSLDTRFDNWARFAAWPYTGIVEATLALTPTEVAADTATYTIYGVLATSHTTPNSRSAIQSLPRTTASAALSLSGAVLSVPILIDVKALLQEVIAQGGWTPGTSDLGLVMLYATTGPTEYVVADAELRITGLAI